MRKGYRLISVGAITMVFTVILFMVGVAGSGVLEPPRDEDGTPLGPDDPAGAMFTLEDLFYQLESGDEAHKRTGAFEEPLTGPDEPTGKSLDDIWGLMPVESCADYGLTYCDDAGEYTYVDTNTDEDHCGHCEKKCHPDAFCVDGDCTFVSCGDGWNVCGGECIDVRWDIMNCGGCGIECESRCDYGTCDLCTEQQTYCESSGCTNLNSDPDNCGSCGIECDWYCVDRVCSRCPKHHLACWVGPPHWTDCFDVRNDMRHCGECDNACNEYWEICKDGSCCVLGYSYHDIRMAGYSASDCCYGHWWMGETLKCR